MPDEPRDHPPALAAPLAGQLSRIRWKVGDAVTAGTTVLAVLQPTDPAFLDPRALAETEARVKVASASKEMRQSELTKQKEVEGLARTELDRTKRLFEQGTGTREKLDQSENKFRVAELDLRASEIAIKVAESELEVAQAALIRSRPPTDSAEVPGQFPIPCPINGRVLRVFQESAAVVAQGAPLVEVGDPSDLEIEVDVLSTDAVRIKPGMRMLLERWGSQEPLEARVRLIEPRGFMKVSALGVEEQRVNVIADFSGPAAAHASLGDGYRVEARVVVWENANAAKAPAGALIRQGTDWACYVIRDGLATLRPIKVGHSSGLDTEILDGLVEGDELILYPSDRIKTGTPVLPRLIDRP